MRIKMQTQRNFFFLLAFALVSLIFMKVQNNRIILAPAERIDITPSATKPVEELEACTPDQRREHLTQTCRTMGFDKKAPTRALRIIVTDDERKLFYCLLPKSGSKSWLYYMIKLAGKVKRGHWHARKPEFMKKAGLNFLRDVTVEEVNTRYKDYYKFAVVRHPLQRLVSAYHEAILKAKHFNVNGKAPSFAEFGRRLQIDMTPRLHWTDYMSDCQFCHVDYDLVIKAETVAHDQEQINEAVGQNVSLEYKHTNMIYDDDIEVLDHHNFKYDQFYRDLRLSGQIESFRTILEVYDADMRLHGYHWDSSELHSYCAIDVGKNKTCC